MTCPTLAQHNYKLKQAIAKQKTIDKGGEAGKSKKIRIYPSTAQKQVLKKWFGTRRFIYNQCVNFYKVDPESCTRKNLRELFINEKNFETENKWLKDTEYDLRDEALSDFLKNVKSNKEKGVPFTLKYTTKKDKQSLSVLAKKWNKKKNFYSSVFKPEILLSAEPLPENLNYTSRIKKDITGKYIIVVPEPLQVQSENQAPEPRSIFIDPGMSPILTCYDPHGKIYKFGEKDAYQIKRLLHYRRKLISKMDLSNSHRQKKNMRKAVFKIYNRIDNLVADFHCKVVKWVVTNFTNVYIPKLNFHKMKKLNKKSKACLASLKLCAFVDRLIDKTREYNWCKVNIVNESFTTKTCSSCGIQNDPRASKIYVCRNCNKSVDRDSNAAINICLRYLSNRATYQVLNQ